MGRRGLLAAALAAGLFVAGCGNDGADDGVPTFCGTDEEQIAGCGDDGADDGVPTFSGTDEEQIAGTVNAMTGAIAAGDGELACGLMTAQGQALMVRIGRQATGEEATDCTAAVPAAGAVGFDPGDFRVKAGEVKVSGDSATVRCDLDGEFALSRGGEGWRVDVPYCNH